METYQLSVSIVAYKNDPEEIAAAIKSVLSTDLRTLCVVVDNSPTQELRKCIEGGGAQYVYPGRNLGFGAGHNVALRKIVDSSEFHLILNPDVTFRQETPTALYRFMNENPEVGLVMPRILYPDGSEQHLCKLLPTPRDLILRRFFGKLAKIFFRTSLKRFELRDLDMTIAREVPCLSGCFMFVRTSVLYEVGLFDEGYFMYMEDFDMCRRIGRRYKTVFYPRVSVTHGYTKGSYYSSRLLKYHMQSAVRYFSKWGWLFDSERKRLNKKIAPWKPASTSQS